MTDNQGGMKGRKEQGLVEKVKERFPEPKTTDTNRPTPDQWLSAWRTLADLTQGIQESDWRYLGVLDLLDGCDRAFEQGNWPSFERLARKVKGLFEK